MTTPNANADPQLIESCASIVEDELTALEAIYPDSITRISSDGEHGIMIKLVLAIELGQPHLVTLVHSTSVSTNSSAAPSSSSALISDPKSGVPDSSLKSLTLSHLPPLILDILLPSTYPLQSPPTYVSCYSTHTWLSPPLLAKLRLYFHSLWEEQNESGEGVLWRIVESITTGSFLNDALNILDCRSKKIPELYLPLPTPSPPHLIIQLYTYNSTQLDSEFAHTSFTCPICFESRKGSACLRLSPPGCENGHVFCKECLREGWGLGIKEGNVEGVRCMSIECANERKRKNAKRLEGEDDGNEEGDVAEEDVRVILTEEEVKRWKWLKTKRDIERDPTIVHCPLAFCQAPVKAPRTNSMPDPHADTASESVNTRQNADLGEYSIGWQKLRTCDACGFSFCMFCKKAWHGPLTRCTARPGTSLVKEYLSLPASSQRRTLIEKTLGKSNLEKMVRAYEEDEMNRLWLEKSTTRCPGCDVSVEKSYGCNHMSCPRCLIHYCFRCGVRLDPKNPYQHFSHRGASCYNKLFDLDEDGVPIDERRDRVGQDANADWGWMEA